MPNTNDIRAGGAYVEVRADTSKVANDIDKGVLHELKHGLGSRSDLKEVFDVLKGGGAIVGLTLAANVLGTMAEGGIKFKEAMADADKNAADALAEFGKSLPFLSEFINAGASINELFTGQQAELRDSTEELKRMGDLFDTIKNQSKETKDIFDGWHKTIADMNREIAKLLALPGQQDTQGPRWDLKDRLTAIDKQADAGRDKIDAQIKALRDQRAPFDKALRENPDPGPGPSSDETGQQIANGDFVPTLAIDDWRKAKEAHDRAARDVQLVQNQINAKNVERSKIDANQQEARKRAEELGQANEAMAKLNTFFDAVKQVGEFNVGQDKALTKAKIEAGLAADAARAEHEYRDQQATADIQAEEDKRRKGFREAQNEVDTDIANRRQQILDALPAKTGEEKRAKFEEEQNYLESLGISGKDLERALRQAREDIFGQPSSASQFGGAGAELLGGGAVQERIAKAVEDTAKNTKKLVGSSGGMTFK